MDKGEPRRAHLTTQTVKSAQPSARRYIIWDTKLSGFGLRVTPQGTKTFLIRYRVGGGRRSPLRQFVIGRHNPLTADAARAQAKLLLADVAKGNDPQADKVAKRADLTVSELCDLYLKEGVSTKKATTVYIDGNRIERHIKPLIGKLRLSDVSSADVARLIRDVNAGKTAGEKNRVRGGQAAASRVAGLLSGIFKFAIERKYLSENPAKGVKRFKDIRRERFLSPAELGTLGDTLTAMEAEGCDKAPLSIFRLLALTGCRKNEIVRLKWREVDFERSLLRLEDSKTGQRIVRLGAAALTALNDLPKNDSPYVFPDPRDPKKPYHAIDWTWTKVRDAAGLDGARIHDLRHTFASVGAPSGLLLIGKLLGHSNVTTTSRYAHLADDPLKVAADRISNTISGALERRSADLDEIGQGAASNG